MTALLFLLIIMLVMAGGLALICGAVMYNRLVRLRNLVQESWRQVDVELRRRHDLIPNLVETVKGYAQHERQVLDWVAHARATAVAPGSGPAAQAAQEGALGQALGRLIAVGESYPALRASANFLHLQRELVDTEDRIAAGRRFYNANVRQLNTRTETFPSNLVASTFSVRRAEYFELDDVAMRSVPPARFQNYGR
jgi:LemA protein